MTKGTTQTERCNHSRNAAFTEYAFISPFAQGGFRYCALGKYSAGKRKGEKAVCKWFKTGHVNETRFYEKDIQAMKKAVDLVEKWNENKFIKQMIRVNVPEVWIVKNGKAKALIEPFIENYEKFNSNTGWADSSTDWHKVMQALSHFSYHVSNRKYLLCDVQGGVYSNGVALTDPVILSQTKEYGETDLGPKGIKSFFKHHCCNKFCSPNWKKPKECKEYFEVCIGTSMTSAMTSR